MLVDDHEMIPMEPLTHFLTPVSMLSGLSQSSVFVGEPGLTLSDPDVYSLDVLSSRLNGFGGLLFDELRTREGLAYSVSGGWL